MSPESITGSWSEGEFIIIQDLDTASWEATAADDLGGEEDEEEWSKSLSGSSSQRGTSDSDHITGRSSSDFLYGDAESDVLKGRSGDDLILGGSEGDFIRGNKGDDLIISGMGNNTLKGGTGHDIIIADEGHDRIHGGSGDDRIFGEAGDDFIRGGIGNDYIHGGHGEDKIFGGYGNDTICGGIGKDKAKGGMGSDLFIAVEGNGFAKILDIDITEDSIYCDIDGDKLDAYDGINPIDLEVVGGSTRIKFEDDLLAVVKNETDTLQLGELISWG